MQLSTTIPGRTLRSVLNHSSFFSLCSCSHMYEPKKHNSLQNFFKKVHLFEIQFARFSERHKKGYKQNCLYPYNCLDSYNSEAYFALIYPFFTRSSAFRIAPPAAPRTVLCAIAMYEASITLAGRTRPMAACIPFALSA